MFLAANALDLSTLSPEDATLYAVLGYVTVALGLILAAVAVFVIVRMLVKKFKKPAQVEEAPVEEEIPAPVALPQAPGAAGQLKLHNVEPKTAAMLMAIVADKMGKPINELRFISIKEVE